MKNYIAIDLGASHGRIIAGNLTKFHVIKSFPTYSVRIHDSIFWDIPNIFSEITRGIHAALEQFQGNIYSIGIDAWGVDYGLLDARGLLISLPYHYRDVRSAEVMEEVCSLIPPEKLFCETGLQLFSFNTIFQLYSFKKHHPELYNAARVYLSLPDLLYYWLGAEPCNEITHASTTQLFSPHNSDWSADVIQGLGLCREHFQSLVSPGTHIGTVRASLMSEFFRNSVEKKISLVAVGSHDSASAVATLRILSPGAVFLSSGTWSVMGITRKHALTTPDAYRLNFTNERAVSGDIRFLKNIMGLWIEQECLRAWKMQVSHREVARIITSAPSGTSAIDPTNPVFLAPHSSEVPMDRRVVEYCRKNGQKAPETRAEILATIYRGLVRMYAQTIDSINHLTGKHYNTIHIVGGGSRNTMLNTMLAEETGAEIYTGPSEATALGNLLVQALAGGDIATLEEGAEYLRQDTTIVTP